MKRVELILSCNPISTFDSTLSRCFDIANSSKRSVINKLSNVLYELYTFKTILNNFYELVSEVDLYWSNDYHTAQQLNANYLEMRNVLKKRLQLLSNFNKSIDSINKDPLPNIHQLFNLINTTPNEEESISFDVYYESSSKGVYEKTSKADLYNKWKEYHDSSDTKKLDYIVNWLKRYRGLLTQSFIEQSYSVNILSTYKGNPYNERPVNLELIETLVNNWELVKDDTTK